MGRVGSTSENISQEIFYIQDRDKPERLVRILKEKGKKIKRLFVQKPVFITILFRTARDCTIPLFPTLSWKLMLFCSNTSRLEHSTLPAPQSDLLFKANRD